MNEITKKRIDALSDKEKIKYCVESLLVSKAKENDAPMSSELHFAEVIEILFLMTNNLATEFQERELLSDYLKLNNL